MDANALDLQERVIEAIAFDPRLTAGEVAVTVREGVVTLRGRVSSLDERWNVEDAVKRVRGVRGVADQLVVEPDATQEATDTDIALAIERRFDSNPTVPRAVTFLVQDGCVTLCGEVRWHRQAEGAAAEARRVQGVRSVANLITIEAEVPLTADEVRRRVHEALERTADEEARGITVSISGGAVTLTGAVRTWLDRETAAAAAWGLSGVSHVENRISVRP